MTIDEAITHAREAAAIQRNNDKLNKILGANSPYYNMDCLKCAEEHEQLADWLEELKRRRLKDGEMIGSGALNNAYNQGYNKAIDDFVEAIDKEDRKECLVMDMFEIENIAEQLKKGGTDE